MLSTHDKYLCVAPIHGWLQILIFLYLFSVHVSLTSPSNTSNIKFSLFSVSIVRCKQIAFLSLLQYILQKPIGTSTSAREASKPDWKQNSHAILKMHTVWSPPCCSKNSCRSAFDPFWHLLHYLPFMNNELNITAALKIPVKISSEIMHSSF